MSVRNVKPDYIRIKGCLTNAQKMEPLWRKDALIAEINGHQNALAIKSRSCSTH